MQQSFFSVTRQNSFTRKKEQYNRSTRTKSTGTAQVTTNNAFLKNRFTDIPLTDIVPLEVFDKVTNPQKNLEKLVKAAADYLAQYQKELLFKPSGKFGLDITNLIHAVTQLLPDGQLLNVDYMDKEFIFIVYQPNPKRSWDTIVYLPVSKAHTMRPTVKKLFIRFIAFIMRQNNLPTFKDTYDYDIFIEDIQYRMKDKSEEVDDCYIELMRSYNNKKGKANRLLKQIEQCKEYNPNELIIEMKSLKRLSKTESEQINCMIRGLELLSRDRLNKYVYDNTYDDYHNYHSDEGENRTDWTDLICISWGTYSEDAFADWHFEVLNELCNNYGISEPYSFTILSSEKPEKVPPCTFPFEWLDYICNDFYKHLTNYE